MRSTIISAPAILAVVLLACGEKEQGPPNDSTHSPEGMAAAVAKANQIEIDSIPVRTPDGGIARYGVKSGRITYAYSGTVEGVRDVVFDEWGMRERRYDSSAAVGRPGPPRYGLLITTPESTTVIDLLKKEGWTTPNTADDRYLADTTARGISLGELIFRSSGAQRLPDERFRGLPTRVLKMNNPSFTSTIWVWRGIVLKEHFVGKDGMEFVVEPTQTEFDIEIPESSFETPKGIKLTKRESMEMEPVPVPAPQAMPGQAPAPPMTMPAPPR